MTDNNKEKFNAQELQKLLMQFAAGAADKGPKNDPEPEEPKSRQERIILFIQNTIARTKFLMQESVHYVDRFINFVVKSRDPDRNEIVQYARPPILFGTAVMVVFVGFGGFWAGFAPLDSAAHAMGTVIASKNKQIVQYSGYGVGVVKTIFVKQGDEVKEGDPIVELDETIVKSQYDGALNQYLTWLATENRLVAERDHLSKIEFSPVLFEHDSSEVQKIVHVQTNIFNAAKEVLIKQEESYNKMIKQYTDKLANSKQGLEISRSRLKGMKELLKDGHASKKNVEDLMQAVSQFTADATSSEQEIQKIQIAILQDREKEAQKVAEKLNEAQANLVACNEKFLQAKDALGRVILKSPVDGQVNQVNVHTVGAVVQSGTFVAEVTPNDKLIVEAHIPVGNIDSVFVGQEAKMKFLAFKSRTSPLFVGRIISISPDSVPDQQAAQNFAQHNKMMARAGMYFYIAKIEIDAAEFDKLAKPRGLKLVPGMSCDIQIVTGTRTLIRYLLDPVLDQAFKAFKER